MRRELIKKVLERAHHLNKGVAYRAARQAVQEGVRRALPKFKRIGAKIVQRGKITGRQAGLYSQTGPKATEVVRAHGKRLKYRGIESSVREGGGFPHLATLAREKGRALQPRAMSPRGVARALLPKTKKEIVDNLRDLMCKINRGNTTDYQEPLLSQLIISPPYKGIHGKPEHPYMYPPQLSGVRQREQKQRLEGSAHTGSTFGGVVGGYGSPTGGSYLT